MYKHTDARTSTLCVHSAASDGSLVTRGTSMENKALGNAAVIVTKSGYRDQGGGGAGGGASAPTGLIKRARAVNPIGRQWEDLAVNVGGAWDEDQRFRSKMAALSFERRTSGEKSFWLRRLCVTSCDASPTHTIYLVRKSEPPVRKSRHTAASIAGKKVFCHDFLTLVIFRNN